MFLLAQREERKERRKKEPTPRSGLKGARKKNHTQTELVTAATTLAHQSQPPNPHPTTLVSFFTFTILNNEQSARRLGRLFVDLVVIEVVVSD